MATPSEIAVGLDTVLRCLAYEGGILVWKERVSNYSTVTIGSPAGTALRGTKKKYRAVHIKGKKLFVHRVVWALHNKRWPDFDIDHIDGNEDDNSIENLRETTKSQNSMNRSNRSDNVSGLKGARLRKNRDGSPVWISCIWIDGKAKYLGRFSSAQAAHDAYVSAANEHFGEFARAS